MLVLGVFAVTGAAASGASAAEWSVAGSPLTGSATYSGKFSSPFSWTSEVSSTRYSLNATGGELLESSIVNEGGKPVGKTRIRLTGVTISPWAACSVSGGTITTVPLRTEEVSIGGRAYDIFRPESGGSLFSFQLAKGTGSCALSGTYSVYGEFAARTEGIPTEGAAHEMRFSGAIQKAAGVEMTGGISYGHPANFTGSISESLTGAHAGQTWSANVADKPGEAGEIEEPTETLGNPPKWTVAGSPLTGSATYSVKSAESFKWTSEYGSTVYSLVATGVEMPEATIVNEGGAAFGSTRLKLTGVTISPFGACSVSGGTITTVPLRTEVVSIGSRAYDKFRPVSGGTLFTFTLAKGTGSCPESGTYSVAGEFASRAVGISTEATTHEMEFSGVFQSRAGVEMTGGLSSGRRAEFSGSVVESLTGTHAGQLWKAS